MRFPDVGRLGDIESKKAFLAKCGQEKMDEAIAMNSDSDWTGRQYAMIQKELSIMNVMLSEGSGPFLGGNRPIHADFCVFA